MYLGEDAANHFSVFPGSERSGGGMTVRNRGVGGVKDAWYYLPWSISPIRCPGGVRSRVADRGERRHDALVLPSAACGFVTVARATRFDGAVAGGRVEFDSAVSRAAFAGLFYIFRQPGGEVSGAVHGPN